MRRTSATEILDRIRGLIRPGPTVSPAVWAGVASALLAVAVAISAAPAYADGGTIKGKVVNASANGGSVAGVEVTLTSYFGQTERNKNTAKTDANGNFLFTGLDTSPNYSYEATSNYQKGDYTAPRVSFSGSGDTKEVTLKVYDSTTDESVMKATAKHYVLNAGKGELEVSEILVLNNGSDRTYIGSREVGPDQRATGRYMPPSGAKSLDFTGDLMSCCVVKEGAGLVDTMAINPGETQKILSYKLPYSGSAISFSSTLQQTVERVQVLVPVGVRASVSGLASHGTQNIQGTTYQLYGADNLPADTTLGVDLEGLPANPFGDNPLVLVGMVAATLAGLGGAFYMLKRRTQQEAPVPAFASGVPLPSKRKQRGAAANYPGATGNPAIVELEKRDLLAAMANLDDWFEAGRIGRKDYERLRAEKKERLLLLTRQKGSRGTPARA